MGFFSEIAAEVRRSDKLNRPSASPLPEPAPGQEAPAPSPFPAPLSSVPEPEIAQVPAEPVPAPEPVPVRPDPAPEPASEEKPAPVIDLTPAADAADDAGRRRAHEAAEAKRKAEFDAKQAEKRAARQKQLDQIKAMDGAELLAAAAGRVAADTERLTRRNMKEAVSEHIQAKCREDSAFAVLVMDPDKSMMNCFQYINRKAQEYAGQEMKDQGVQPAGVYGLDIPDGLVYQWAEDYFNDPDAKEDRKTDEKFVPRPYVPSSRKPSKAKPDKKKPAEKTPKKAPEPVMEQISLL